MAVTFAGPAITLDGPAPSPPPYSLLRQVQVRQGDDLDADVRALLGAKITPYPSGLANLWAPCEEGTLRNKHVDDPDDEVPFGAFGVYKAIRCTARATDSEEILDKIRTVFTAIESEAVERELLTAPVQPDNPNFDSDAVKLSTSALSPIVGISLLEREIGETAREGLIHVPPVAAPALGQYVEREGDTLRVRATRTRIIVGAGYAGGHPAGGTGANPDSQAWIYATGPITVYRGPIEIFDAYDHDINDHIALVERQYLATWDRQLTAAVRIDFTL